MTEPKMVNQNPTMTTVGPSVALTTHTPTVARLSLQKRPFTRYHAKSPHLDTTGAKDGRHSHMYCRQTNGSTWHEYGDTLTQY